MAAYLDKSGLTYLWSKIKAYIDSHSGGESYHLAKSGNTITLTGTDGTSDSVTDDNTTYSNATTSAAGLMSAADKTKLNNLATRITASGGTEIASKNMASASSTSLLATMPALDAGIYFINIHVEWASNSSGWRTLTVSGSSGGTAISGQFRRRVAPVNGAATNADITAIVAPTSNGRVYYINAGQNSGSTLSVSGIYQIYRLA